MNKKQNWFKKHWIFSSILCILFLFIIVGNLSEIDKSEDNLMDEFVQKPRPLTYEQAKKESVNVTYDDLMRHFENYEGKYVCFDGEVEQVVSDKPQLELRVDTGKQKIGGYFGSEPTYYYSGETIYLYSNNYKSERILVGDMISVCGKSTGILEYETVLGNKISVPGVNIETGQIRRIKQQ